MTGSLLNNPEVVTPYTTSVSLAPTSTLFDNLRNRAGLLPRHYQDVLKTIENYLDDLRVLNREEVTEGWDHILLDQVLHL